VVTALAVVAMGAYAWHNRDIFSELVHIRPDYILWLVVLWVPYEAIPGLRIRAFLAWDRIRLSPSEWFGLSVISDMANWLLPFQGGAVPSAMYLKRRYGVAYLKYVSIMVGSYLLFFVSTSTLGLIVSGLVYLKRGGLPVALPLFFAVVLVGTTMVLILSPTIPTTGIRLVDYAGVVLESWKEMKNDRQLVWTIAGQFVLGSVVTGLTLYISYRALSLQMDLLSALLLSIVAVYAIFVKLTPANLGIREALVAFASEMIGSGFDEGLLAALLFRAVNLGMVMVFGPLFTYVLTRRARSSSLEDFS
jgi:uncharacterized membrane protein YbhN (UPF0104 family)